MTQVMDPKPKLSEDASSASDFESIAGKKVQLDIDDAPFLLEEEKPADPPVPVASAPPVEMSKEEAPAKSKKKLIILGAAVVLLLVGAAAVYFLLFRGPTAPPPPPPPTQPVIVVPNTPPPPTAIKEHTTKLAPFWVDLTDSQGKRHFLVASFVMATEDAKLNQEINEKIVTLRDATFYYLSNKSYAFLADPNNSELIRADLLGTINNYLIVGELKSLYFDSYLMQ